MYIEENKPVSAQGIDAARGKNENFPAGDKNNNDMHGCAVIRYHPRWIFGQFLFFFFLEVKICCRHIV